jgi:hypothetical protein
MKLCIYEMERLLEFHRSLGKHSGQALFDMSAKRFDSVDVHLQSAWESWLQCVPPREDEV